MELESDLTNATSATDGSDGTDGIRRLGTRVTAVQPEVTVETTGTAPVEANVQVQPAARGRRRRGRVVAPAGPPRASSESRPTGGA